MARKKTQEPKGFELGPVVQYRHHGKKVSVRKNIMGQHRTFCLCHSCALFNPDFRNLNCPIANENFALCVKYNVVTPVWECPDYKEAK